MKDPDQFDPDGPPVAVHYHVSITPGADAALRAIQRATQTSRHQAISDALILYRHARTIIDLSRADNHPNDVTQ